ncbi:hypothetical protein JCM10914A_30420 [Paenibacillus sp. JCM 10914]|uniref:hypothetical protein n=1 Tax=Paenibacillus sp. JCM 10914 TaxID=1236974 RepID=UPI000B219A4F|nr:hypothetical protein [Paenibacillus sp. JCM 10914]
MINASSRWSERDIDRGLYARPVNWNKVGARREPKALLALQSYETSQEFLG